MELSRDFLIMATAPNDYHPGLCQTASASTASAKRSPTSIAFVAWGTVLDVTTRVPSCASSWSELSAKRPWTAITDGSLPTPIYQKLNSCNHRPSTGNDVINENRPASPRRIQILEPYFDIPVSTPHLFENRIRCPCILGHRCNPLLAFAIWPDDEGLLYIVPDPFRYQRRCVNDSGWNRVNLTERTVTMKVWINGHHPIK
jgi:hypothetical protein